jgi:protein-tyrosine-phosphatase
MVPPDGVSGGYRGNRPPMLGGSGVRRSRPQQPQETAVVRDDPPPPDGKKRVLFLCIGNAVRSQMAEAFARTYGSDVLTPCSAGLSPAVAIAPLTRQILEERNIRVDGQFPKGLEHLRGSFDLVVNLSGQRVSFPGATVVDWPVPDPIGQSAEVYRSAADVIEGLVMGLILELRPA